MLGIGKAFLNDNIRTEHLKCSHCRTQIFLSGIDHEDGGEVRTFGCPHCRRTREVRLTPQHERRTIRIELAGESGG